MRNINDRRCKQDVQPEGDLVRTRLINIALIGAVAATVVTGTPAGAQLDRSASLPPECPADTARTTIFAGDEFDDADLYPEEWTITPGGPFQIIRKDEFDSALRGANPTTAGVTQVERTAEVALPSDRTSLLRIANDVNLDAGSKAIVELGVNGAYQPLASYDAVHTGERNGFDFYDLSAQAGQQLTLRFSIDATNTTFSGTGTGWTMTHVHFISCDPYAPPAAPRSLKVRDIGSGTAEVNWTEPPYDTTNEPTGYQLTMSPGDLVREYDHNGGGASRLFSELTPGTTYTFSVRAHGVAGSGPPAVAYLAGIKVSTTVSSTTVAYGNTFTIKGSVRRADTGEAAPGVWAVLRVLDDDNQWTGVGSPQTTASDGSVVFTHKPRSNNQYQISTSCDDIDGGCWPSQSATRTVNVRPKVTGAFSTSTTKRGSTAKFSGAVAPNHTGKTIYFQRRRSDGTWHTEKSTTLSSSSSYAFSRYFGTRGTYYFRTYIRAHDDHTSGWSTQRKITVY